VSPKLRPFALTWRSAIALSDLPRTTRAVAWALANYMNEAGESAFPSVMTLCRAVGNERGDGLASKSTVIDALRLLEEGGWLEKVRSGGGRGHKSEWQARIPERVQQLHRSGSREDVPAGSVRQAVSRSLKGLREAPAPGSAADETVQPQHPLGEGERVQSPAERVQLLPVNGAATAPEVDRTKNEVAAAGAELGNAAVTDAAAALLDEHLKRLGCGPALRRRALADPLRAKAWLDIAQTNAESNVAGYFRTGLDSGEWPSPRIDREGPKATRQRWAYETSLQLEPGDADAVVDDWPDLDDVERQELREWVEHARARADAKAADAA
jgi:hypothetical protein